MKKKKNAKRFPMMKIIYEKRKRNENLKKKGFGSQNKRPKYSFLFSKCILSNYWDEKKLESFLEFLTVEKLTKYIPKMYEELDAQQFANLLFGLKNDLTTENFKVLEKQWSSPMWETDREFLDAAHEIFTQLENY